MTQDNNQKEDVDWENLFKPEDFKSTKPNADGLVLKASYAFCEYAAAMANLRLREAIEKYGKRVYGQMLGQKQDTIIGWYEHRNDRDTHQATLINIRKIDE